ncbi:hypothetical protein O3S68_20115 [Kosakonia sp. SOY2]|uniref:hypothetical protein n=1 Tax=Kosakonia sp. SOY2 TaxID=3014557 RepID=UPI0022AC44D9|nr:hypothetical protein [Kosakonia sp. SOY2]MCZ3384594.1 hypothetical protein [Kosakonia sp. SOY2]
MNLQRFITEYDESLSGELNIDPLGQLIVWSSFGQQIFRNRISSVANDVRHYTLNLLHHYVIRSVLGDDKTQLGDALQKIYGGKNDVKLTHACLIFLENIYTLSMCDSQSKKGVVTTGVLGIVKARKLFADFNNPPLIFGHGSDSQLLTQQLFLGTNGRYKTPMMNMHFFDQKYHYQLAEGISAWEQAGQFILQTPQLKTLFRLLCDALQMQLGVRLKRDLTLHFADIDKKLTQAYVQAFRSSEYVGNYARDFWFEMTRLREGASGALYHALEQAKEKQPAADIYHRALRLSHNEADRRLLRHIVHVEPYLAAIDLLFAGIWQRKKQTLEDIRQFWAQRGLDDHTLPKRAEQVINDKTLLPALSGTAHTRLERLLHVAQAPSVAAQTIELLKYHEYVMQSRGQLPWITLTGETLTLQVPARPMHEDRKNDDWVNGYYIPQFRYMLKGLCGEEK